MELAEAREMAGKLRNSADKLLMDQPIYIARLIILLDDRITELEKERDELEKIVIELGGVGALPIKK